jgi:hypothetical protein
MFAEMLKVPYQDNLLNDTQMVFILAGKDKSEKYMLESLIFSQSKACGYRAFTIKHKRS